MVLCPMLRTKFPYLSLSDRISSMIKKKKKKKKERTIYQSRVSWRNHVTPNFLLVSCLPVNSIQASHYVQYLLCSRTYNHALSLCVLFLFCFFSLSSPTLPTNESQATRQSNQFLGPKSPGAADRCSP